MPRQYGNLAAQRSDHAAWENDLAAREADLATREQELDAFLLAELRRMRTVALRLRFAGFMLVVS